MERRGERRPGTWSLVRVFFRSLLIQASLNYSKMQNLGFAFALIPLVKGIDEKKRQSDILKRHIRFFNSHPYFSAPILGTVARLEYDASDDEQRRRVDGLKEALMAPYAALGDPFFWGAWKPFSAFVGVMAALGGIAAAPLLMVGLYNAVHLPFRGWAFVEGCRDGRGALNFIGSLKLPERTGQIKLISAVVLSLITALAIPLAYPASGGVAQILLMTGILGTVLACYWLIKRGVPVLAVLYGVAFLVCVVSVL